MALEESGPESLKGYFLISESNMPDPNFFQTVVLMLEHNSEGAFGLIVNRRSHLCLSDVLDRHSSERARSTPIYVGGPVQQEYLFVLHSELPDRALEPGKIQAVSNVYFEPFFNRIEHFFQDDQWQNIPADDRPSIHLFLGYAGWGAGQLEKEMEQGSWIIHPARDSIVFHPEPDLGWRDALRAKGGIYKYFAESNQNPALN